MPMHLTTEHQCLRQKWMEMQEVSESTLIVGEFKTPLLASKRQKSQYGHSWTQYHHQSTAYTGIYRLLHATTSETYCFPSLHGIFTKIELILGHKTHLNRFNE